MGYIYLGVLSLAIIFFIGIMAVENIRCHHAWDLLKQINLRSNDDDRIQDGICFVLQCKKCKKIKKINIDF